MKTIIKYYLLCLLILFVSPYTSFAWEENVTHKDLSDISAGYSVLSKSNGDYLKNLGFNKEMLEELTWNSNKKTIKDWITEGSKLEDEGTYWEMITNVGRSNNHFHNPLKPWASAGLDDDYTLGEIVYNVVGQSALLWAQNPAKQGAFRNDKTEWDWSWQTVRAYYYMALTSTSAIMRQEYFARTFRGVGHQVHLVQDMAVPAHVRNDSHVRDMGMYNYLFKLKHFETWAMKENEKIKLFAAQYNTAKHKPTVDMIRSIQNGELSPTTQFFDTDQYTGSTPPPIVADLTWGLSEYTNANFVSDDTIFTDTFSSSDLKYFPYPRYNPSCYQVVTEVIGANPEGGSIVEEYIKRTCDGEKIDKFLAFNPSHNLFASSTGDRSSFFIDHAVYEAHAKELVPRAVGYSVALIDYFFRGTIEISLSEDDVYAVTDNQDGSGFGKITLNARNTTDSGEAMTDGDISLVIKYKLAQSDPFQNQAITKSEFKYIVVPESTGVRSIPADDTVKLTFNLAGQPLPVWATDVYIQVIYKGKLGAEDGAVAVGFKDISEPTPFDYINIPKVCLFGNWELFNNETIAKADLNLDGTPDFDVFPHDFKDVLIKISSSQTPESRKYPAMDNHTYRIDRLESGNYRRIYLLVGDHFSATSKVMEWLASDARDTFTHFTDERGLAIVSINGVTNQLKDGLEYYPEMKSFMNVYRWLYFRNNLIILRPGETECSWESYGN
jgi:hypothetical protein